MTKWLFINLTVHSPAVLHLLLFWFYSFMLLAIKKRAWRTLCLFRWRL